MANVGSEQLWEVFRYERSRFICLAHARWLIVQNEEPLVGYFGSEIWPAVRDGLTEAFLLRLRVLGEMIRHAKPRGRETDIVLSDLLPGPEFKTTAITQARDHYHQRDGIGCCAREELNWHVLHATQYRAASRTYSSAVDRFALSLVQALADVQEEYNRRVSAVVPIAG